VLQVEESALDRSLDTSGKASVPPASASPSEEVVFRLEGDLRHDGTFGSRVLEVTRQAVRICQDNNGQAIEIPMAEVKSPGTSH